MIRKPGRDGKSAAQRHLNAIERGEVTKTNVIGIRKALNHVERLRAGWPGNRSSVTPAEADVLEAALARLQPTVTGELHESGLKVLRSPRYSKRWNDRQAAIIERLDRFALVRFDRIGDAQTVPVYRAISNDRGTFLFRNIPWQSTYYRGEQSGPVVLTED